MSAARDRAIAGTARRRIDDLLGALVGPRRAMDVFVRADGRSRGGGRAGDAWGRRVAGCGLPPLDRQLVTRTSRGMVAWSRRAGTARAYVVCRSRCRPVRWPAVGWRSRVSESAGTRVRRVAVAARTLCCRLGLTAVVRLAHAPARRGSRNDGGRVG